MGGRAVLDTCAGDDRANAFGHTAQAPTLSSCFRCPVGGESGQTVGYTLDSSPSTVPKNITIENLQPGQARSLARWLARSRAAFLLLGWS